MTSCKEILQFLHKTASFIHRINMERVEEEVSFMGLLRFLHGMASFSLMILLKEP